MSLVDELRAAIRAPASIWLQFTRSYDPSTSDVWVFLEGEEDAAFYLPLIRGYLPLDRRVHPFICWGRDGVFAAFRDITSRTPNVKRVLFFVDSDLDAFLSGATVSDPRIYRTDHYSIENWLVSAEVLESVWTDLFALPVSDERFSVAKRAFAEASASFARSATTIMAMILMYRRKNTKLNLSNVPIQNIFEWRGENQVRRVRKSLPYIVRACGLPPGRFWRDVLPVFRALRSEAEPKRFVRGKFELWFFVAFLGRLLKSLRESSDPATTPNRNAQISLSSAVAQLAPRLRAPESLRAFLRGQLTST